jgi:hypothetical protein
VNPLQIRGVILSYPISIEKIFITKSFDPCHITEQNPSILAILLLGFPIFLEEIHFQFVLGYFQVSAKGLKFISNLFEGNSFLGFASILEANFN